MPQQQSDQYGDLQESNAYGHQILGEHDHGFLLRRRTSHCTLVVAKFPRLLVQALPVDSRNNEYQAGLQGWMVQ